MRIAFVVDRFPRLSETFVLGQVAGLIDAGHDVRIYADREDSTGLAHAPVERLALRERTRYGRNFPDGKRGRQARAGIQLLRRVTSGHLPAGTLYRAVARSGSHALPALAYEGGDGEFDAIVAHFGPNGAKALEMRRAGIFSGPLLTVFHGYDMNARRRSVRRGYRGLLEEGDLFLPINEYFRRRLIEWGAPPGRTRVHHMGVDLKSFPLTQRRMTDGILRVVSIARLVPKKGLEYGIRAVAALKSSAQYTIVGDGPEHPYLAALIRKLNAEDRIRLAGWKTQDDVAALLSESHVLLAPSITAPDGDEEGIPVALMEAMATGMPVVSTLHSGIPELVEDGVSGFLVPEGDVDLLQSRLEWLQSHPTHWEWMGRAGRRTIESFYNAPVLNERLIEILRSVARSPGTAEVEHGVS